MTDLTALREIATEINSDEWNHPLTWGDTLTEAVAEIESLRKKLAAAKKAVGKK